MASSSTPTFATTISRFLGLTNFYLVDNVVVPVRRAGITSRDLHRNEKAGKMKTLFLIILTISLSTGAWRAEADELEGLWQGYDGEWGHVSRQLVSLAQTIPADKFSWRPGPGVRSTSEVFMHIALANFFLLSVTGPPMPSDLDSPKLETAVTSKREVIRWLERSLEAVKVARAALRPGDLQRKVKVSGRDATVDGMYLRIIVHANEHMGQLIAYARVNGIVPPWSVTAK